MTAWQLLGLGFICGVVATVALGVVLAALHEVMGS